MRSLYHLSWFLVLIWLPGNWNSVTDSAWAIEPNADREVNIRLTDVVATVQSLSTSVRKLETQSDQIVYPDGGHFQGIQAYRSSTLQEPVYLVSSDSRTKAYLLTVCVDQQSPAAGHVRHLQYLPSDGRQPPLRHAGGIQIIGDYLVVGVEDNQAKLRSQIQFWNVSDPLAPQLQSHLTVTREGTLPKDKTAGAVGIVKRRKDHLLVVGNWDSRDLDFYVSNSLPLSDEDCRFSFHLRWTADNSNRNQWLPDQAWGSYQAINLVSDEQDRVYLFGLHTNRDGENRIDLCSVNLTQPPAVAIRKLFSRQIPFADGMQFRYAGGISIVSPNRLGYLATERNHHGLIGVSP